jgi:hypothetical protein
MHDESGWSQDADDDHQKGDHQPLLNPLGGHVYTALFDVTLHLMLPRPQWIEYHLNHEGEWLREPAPRTVAVARVGWDGALTISGATAAAEAYLEKLTRAHPFDAKSVRRWAIFVGEAPRRLVLGRNRYEAARAAAAEGLDPTRLKVVEEAEMDGATWASLSHS